MRFISKAMKQGIKAVTVESISPVAQAKFGLCDLRGDKLEQNKAIAGQNDYAWWLGHEDMTWRLSVNIFGRKRRIEELEPSFFRAMASGGYITFEHLNDGSYRQPAWQRRGNHLMRAERDFLSTATRRMLPDGQGVRWLKDGREVRFCYTDQARPADTVEELIGASRRTLAPGEGLKAWSVYAW
jgi:hypothetical protein